MPYYDFKCEKCQTTFEKLLLMKEMELPLTEPCPECGSKNSVKQEVSVASIGDSIRLGLKKPDAGWGEVLNKVQKAHPKGDWSNKKYTPTAGR
jgi:putative FmdB family regulatory protein